LPVVWFWKAISQVLSACWVIATLTWSPGLTTRGTCRATWGSSSTQAV
jgi:hypothetical protein